ncbi:hypothetical protein NEAUS03_1187 [Nematocida ausubeli]|nr:hypothetical protein NEAUS03_1187 [Nematocida ausubeli]
MNLINNDENNMIAGPSNGSGIEVTIGSSQGPTGQQRGLKNDLPTTSAGSNDWNMEVSSETEGMQAGTEETNLNNESVLTKTMNVLKDTASEAYRTFNKLEEVCANKFAKKMSAIGLPITEEEHEYTELKPMRGLVVGGNSQGTSNGEGTVYVESKSEGIDWEKLRRKHEDASNQTSGLIGTKPPISPLKIMHASILCILTSFLLGVSFYSIIMEIRIISRDFKHLFTRVSFSLNLFVVFLAAIITAINCVSILMLSANELWCRQTNLSIAASIGVLLYGMIAVIWGIMYPCLLNPYKIRANLYWIAASLLATLLFTVYIGLFRKAVSNEMKGWVKTSMFKPNIPRMIIAAVFMIIFIGLLYLIHIIDPTMNNMSV